MRKIILYCLIGGLFLQACSNRDSEIVALIKSMEMQNDEVKLKIVNLQGVANNALVELNKYSAGQAATDVKIQSIQTSLTSVLNQLNTLNAQVLTSNTNASQIKAKLDLLQIKCDELIVQMNLLNLQYNPDVIKKGLVAYYPFNGNANDIFGIKGIYTGNKYVVGFNNFSNNALEFNNSEYVRTEKIIENVSNNFTMSAWVNPKGNLPVKVESIDPQGGNFGQPVIHPTHGSNWGDVSQNAGVGLYFGNNQIQVVEHTHLYVAYPLVYSGNFNDWNFVVIVYENHIPKLYLNGELVSTGKVSNIKFVRPSNGNDFTTYGNYSTSGFGSSFSPGVASAPKFVGQIDDIGIWNRPLSKDEIKYIYQNKYIPNK